MAIETHYTGKRFRLTLFGRIILQIQLRQVGTYEVFENAGGRVSSDEYEVDREIWRDAKVEDLTAIPLYLPTVAKTDDLTGNVRYRANWRGKLVLQVERKVPNDNYNWDFIWKDAKFSDINGRIEEEV